MSLTCLVKVFLAKLISDVFKQITDYPMTETLLSVACGTTPYMTTLETPGNGAALYLYTGSGTGRGFYIKYKAGL